MNITIAINDNDPGWRIVNVDSREISVGSHTILSCKDYMFITAMAFTGFRLQFEIEERFENL